MMKGIWFGAAALVLASIVPATAQAQSPGWSGTTFCTSNLNACASVTLVVSDGGHTLTVTVTNLAEGYPGAVTTLGLFHSGVASWGGSVTGFTALSDTRGNVTSAWNIPATNSALGLELDWNPDNPQVTHGILYGETITFTIALDGAWEHVDNTHAAWRYQGEDSDRCYTNGREDYCSPSVVPEPISMALLGAGLAGLGGFSVLRRRRKGLDIENA